jgi:hypothetical protein
MSYIGNALIRRIESTMKINSKLSYMDALSLVLRTEGVFDTIHSSTAFVERQRSAMVKQCTNQETNEMM